MAAEQKEEVSSLNLNLSLHACSSLSVPVCRLARDHGVQFNLVLYHLPPFITHLQRLGSTDATAVSHVATALPFY